MLLYLIATKLGSHWGLWRFSTVDILAVYLWAVIHDRPISWAADRDNWPDDVRPRDLPSQSTLSRRLRHADAINLMTEIENHLMAVLAVRVCLVRILDGKGLPVSKISHDRDIGYGRGAGVFQTGYKLHAVWDRGPMPLAWALAPMNVNEKRIARTLIPTLPGGGYLLCDGEYDANGLYDVAAAAGFQLVAPKTRDRGRGGLGHRRQSPFRLRSIALMKSAFGRALFRERSLIERKFGNLTSCGGGLSCLPPWVRRFPRVRNWIHAKILIHGVRWLVTRHQEQLALA
jgi:hypothetical protein